MTNYDRLKMQKINGVSRTHWEQLLAAAKKREIEQKDAVNWLGAPNDAGANNN